MSTTARSADHQRAVLELRRSGAARPVPARKIRKQNTRRDAKRAAISEEN